MKVTLKLFATLGSHLPPEAHENAVQLDLPDDTTPNQIIDTHGVPRKMAHLVLVNGVYLPPESRDEGRLSDGDTLAIWPPVAGG